MVFIFQFLFLVATYFVASIPFGLVLTKYYLKQDIRLSGSGNIGATNVTRLGGKKLGFMTLILDGLKGMLMIFFARFFFYFTDHLHAYLGLVAFVAVLGHIYPYYLKFKGGKGVATALFCLLALDPAVGFLVVAFWIMTFVMFRISSVASIIAIASSIILSNNYDAPTSQIVLCVALTILITVRHKENLLRLMLGEEKKI